MSRQVSIKEAAELLGVSRKTVERRIKSGQLSATKEGRCYVVDLPDDIELPSLSGHQPATVATETRLAAMEVELEAVRGERDRLIGQLADASRQVDQLTATVFQMSQTQKLLTARAESRRQRPGVIQRIRDWWRGTSVQGDGEN